MATNIGSKNLKVWLNFQHSPVEDLKGNTWTTYGNPTIGTANAFNGNALQLDGQSYIKLSGLELFGQDFSIDGWVYVDSASPDYANIFSIVSATTGNPIWVFSKSNTNKLQFWDNANSDLRNNQGYSYAESTNSVGNRIYFKFNFNGKFNWYLNNNSVTSGGWRSYSRQPVNIYIGTNGLIGAIDELRIYDGTLLPADAADYSGAIYFNADIKTDIHNAPLEWRYENPGTADLLTTSGTTVTGLTPTQSKTGTAFYQTSRAKCFDIPSTKDIWIKFDVYFDGTNRWRAYNGSVGITAWNSTNTAPNALAFFDSAGNQLNYVQNVCKPNQLQTFLLHMVSGSSSGIIEAWLDDTKLYTYTGNVNNGDAFADIYLQSDGAGTFFSNVIISNAPLNINEDVDLHTYLTVDLVRSTSNAVTATFDTSRSLVTTQTVNADTSRNTAVAASLNADSIRNVSKALTATFDTARKVANAVNVNLDTARELAYGFKESIDFRADSVRNVSNALNANIDTARTITGAITVSADTARIISVPCTVAADTLRIVTDPNVWRYANYGTADLLSVAGTTVDNLDKSQAIYKIAFYQTSRAKCFDIPSTKEIWIKCDVYCNLTNKWRIYNEGTAGTTGICSQTNKDLDFWANTNNVKTYSNSIIENQLQTVLLHMVSDSSAGIVEAWLDDTKLYTYTGNVNNGDALADIYLQSDGAGTFFSNVIISPVEIGLNENTTLDQNVTCDLLRFFPSTCLVSLDTARNVLCQAPIDIDTYRLVTHSVLIDADLLITVNYAVQMDCDVIRTLPHSFILSPVEDFGGVPDTSNDAQAKTQSIEIRLNEQSLTDEVVLVTVKPVDIMEQVKGQYLDYKYNMRVETCKQRGILNTCTCCSDIDEILYKQLEYTIPDNELWRFTNPEEVLRNFPGIKVFRRDSAPLIEEDDDNSEDLALASTHIATIANIIGKKPILQYADFISTVDINSGGTTYNDLIRSIFGWTSRIPQHLINCFLRDEKLFVVQRGYEQNEINLSDLRGCEIVGVDKELMRTIWGSSVWSKTETREVFGFRYLDNLKWSEDTGDGEESSQDKPHPVSSVTHTTGGLVEKTVEQHDGVTTTTYYKYDSDDLLIQTDIYVESKDVHTHTETRYKYVTLGDGRKVLEEETIIESELTSKGWIRVDEKTTRHEYTAASPGQVHHYTTDSEGTKGTVVGNGTGDDRRTPYLKWITAKGHKSLISYTSKQKNYQQQRTIYGLTPFDTSFPVHGDEKLIEITDAIKWLNRKTQETLTINLFDYPHVIDFNDRIVINGNTYYLKGNTALKTTRIVNKQTLALVRWY